MGGTPEDPVGRRADGEASPCPECGGILDLTTVTNDFPCPWCGTMVTRSGTASTAKDTAWDARSTDSLPAAWRGPRWLRCVGWFMVGVLCPPIVILGVALMLLLGGLAEQDQPPAGAATLGSLIGPFAWRLGAEAMGYWMPLIGGG